MPLRLDPACPSQTHQSVTAIRRKPSCTCPGPHHEAFEQFRQQENAKRAQYHRNHNGCDVPDTVVAPDFYSPPVPEPTFEAGRLEMELHERDDLPCRDEDPELFFIVSSKAGNAKLQEAAAKSVCRRCDAVDDCLTMALRIGDDWAVLGQTTPAERRVIRSQMAGRVA